MDIEGFTEMILKYFEQIAPELCEEYGITLDPLILKIIQNKMRETLDAEKKTLDQHTLEAKFPYETIIKKAVTDLSLSMILQAKKEDRLEIMPGDYELALISLKWEIWPFCSSSNTSLIKGKTRFD